MKKKIEDFYTHKRFISHKLCSKMSLKVRVSEHISLTKMINPPDTRGIEIQIKQHDYCTDVPRICQKRQNDIYEALRLFHVGLQIPFFARIAKSRPSASV